MSEQSSEGAGPRRGRGTNGNKRSHPLEPTPMISRRNRQNGAPLSVVSILLVITVALMTSGVCLGGAESETAPEESPEWWNEIRYARFDDDGDGIVDSYRLDTARASVVAIDSDDDGILDQWMVLSREGIEFRVKDRDGDGVLDWWYAATGQATGKMAVDSDYDGSADELRDVEIVPKYRGR